MKVGLIAGATGLIGRQLLELLLNDPEYHQVKAISRKPLNIINSKLENIVADYNSVVDNQHKLKADDVFCCLGTTMKTAGSKEAFEKIDFEYPLLLAKLSKQAGARQYFLVSALGADKESAIFYNKVKGKTEDAIAALHYPSFHIFRPSLLLGDRKEDRPGEDAAKFFYRVFGFLIPKKYKGIDSLKVARAMHHFARQEQEGKHIHESAELQSY